MRLLKKLHEELGTTFRIPTVSGKELDLHLLYIQVGLPLENFLI